jgi:hypothetical protein
MSPHRQISFSSNRHPSSIQDIFLGLAFVLQPATSPDAETRKLQYTAVLHDGTGVVESEDYQYDFKIFKGDEIKEAEEVNRFVAELLKIIRKAQTEKGYNVGSVITRPDMSIASTSRNGQC